jgi:TRAP transporter TAXI family solute receptor
MIFNSLRIKKMKKILFYAITIVLLSTTLQAAKFITIGTGSINGLYYPTGGAICKLINMEKKKNNLRCAIEPTGGSINNILSIKDNSIELAIAQSDIIYQAYEGKGKFKDKPIKKIRTIMAIYPELLTLIVRKDANIKKLLDIQDKNINIGADSSGTQATVKILLENYEALFEKNIRKSTFETSECSSLIKESKIDGYFYVVGHPTENIKNVANYTPIDIISIDLNKNKNFFKKYPYYARGIIPKNIYKGVNKNAKSFGVKATLVSSSDMDDESVTSIIKAIIENFDRFKKLNPAFKSIEKKSLVKGIGAPLHKAAKKYYQKIGIIK